MKILTYQILVGTYLILTSVASNAQDIHYTEIRDSVSGINCGVLDSAKVEAAYQRLMDLDSNNIQRDSNLGYYYQDVAWSNYLLSDYRNNSKLMAVSNEYYRKALKLLPNDIGILWDFAFTSVQIGNCEQGRAALYRYKRLKRLDRFERRQIKLLRKRCK